MILRSKLDWSLRFALISGLQAVYHWHWANSSKQASKQWTSLNSKHFSKHACIHVDIICQRYLNSLLLTFFADGNHHHHHHVLQKDVFAPSCFYRKLCSIYKIQDLEWLRERERERERRGEEGAGREKRTKKREEEERKGILPFGNGCGSGAHWVLQTSKPKCWPVITSCQWLVRVGYQNK